MQPAETIADLDIERHALDSLDSAEWTWAHWKAILVAGSGFLTDSYDNFVISLMVPMIAYTYYGSSSLPSFEDGWIKAASSYGNLVGQLLFGYLGDILGRKKIYGVELMILIVGAIGCALAAQPAKGISLLANLGFWRFILGIGVGGDYPASGVITAEFASSKNRGTMVALVFAMQGVGIMLGAIVSVLTLLVMKSSIEADTQNLDYCWRFVAGFGVVPALLAVYYRLTITETPRFTMHVKKNKQKALQDVNTYLSNDNAANPKPAEQIKGKVNVSKNHRQTFMTYFSTWPHLKILIACSVCWFLLDIGYYGTNLNTSVVLSAIGFSDKSTPFRFVWNTAVGQLIIAICGNVPGYWFTVHFVDKWGRKPIQLMGFAALTICFAVLAAAYDFWKASAVPGFIVIYSLAQFFFVFFANLELWAKHYHVYLPN